MMIEALNRIAESMQFAFVRNALIAVAFVSVCAALLGVVLVLKRFSMIGDGLTHVAFGAMCVAGITGITNNLYIVLPVTVAVAIILLKTKESKKIKGDALIAMMSVGALAIGYLLLSVFHKSSNVAGDVCTSLFGAMQLMTLTPVDVWVSVGLSASVILFFVLFYNTIFSVTLDENFARASGTKAGAFNIVLSTVIALVVVAAMKLVGSLLVSALVIFPALSAMRVWRSFKGVSIASSIISLGCALLGFFGSIALNLPVGPSIVVVDIVAFGVFYLIGVIRKGRRVA